MSDSRSLLRAVVSADALCARAISAVAGGGTIADLRGDAFGHGVIEAARVVTAAGVRMVVVDDRNVVRHLADLDIDASVDRVPDIDSDLLYGLSPAPGTHTNAAPMQLSGRVMSTKTAAPGDGVSYGYTHRVTAPTVLALVTGGYAQGVARALGNQVDVEIGGVLHPVVGRVAMDVCVVDLETADAGAAENLEGADAVYFGGSGVARSTLARWAELTRMTARELITVAGEKAVREWTN